MLSTRTLRVLLIACAVLSTSCTKEVPPPAAAPPAKSSAAKDEKALIVSAAASTKEVVETLIAEFSRTNGVDVKVNAGPSNALATQIVAGAPADLFLSANAKWANDVEQGGQTAESVRLLTNHLVIVVPKGNPAQVHDPKDLLSDGVQKVALAGEQVPAGMYAEQALTKLDLLKPLIDSGKIVRGQDVRTALAYAERGEAEAGIVYSTDVGVAPGLESAYQFDPKLHDEIVYVLVLTKMGATRTAGRELFEFLKSPAADATYAKFGFVRLH